MTGSNTQSLGNTVTWQSNLTSPVEIVGKAGRTITPSGDKFGNFAPYEAHVGHRSAVIGGR